MRVLIAFDKFKDALTARQACAVAAEVLHARHPEWSLDPCPLTDGGEGFGETLTHAAQGRLGYLDVTGPLGENVRAAHGVVQCENLPATVRARLNLGGTGSLAVIDMAAASGLMLVPPAQRNPWRAGSRGTGELLAHAARQNVGGILLGVGGSATNDLGFGALAALGFRFLNEKDEPIASPTPDRWESVTRIERSPLTLPPVYIACDVTNPLLGPTGATATFGPQKGLSPADQPKLEAQAARLAALLCTACGKSLSLAATPGAGAAGGIAFGLMVACDAQLVSGYNLVSDWLDLPARLAAADLVLTGEGRFDATSLGGKGPGRLVAEAQRLGKTAHVFAGSVGLTPPSQTEGPEDNLLHAITPAGMPLEEALPRTAELLAAAIAGVF
jgi:glycerate kinase